MTFTTYTSYQIIIKKEILTYEGVDLISSLIIIASGSGVHQFIDEAIREAVFAQVLRQGDFKE